MNEKILYFVQLMHNPNRRTQNSTSANDMSVTQKIKISIEKVSTHSKFQRRMVIFFMLIAFISNIQSSSSHLYYMTPVFSCENMDYKVHEDEACSMMDFCTIIDKGTITAELGIYCGEKKDQRTLLQSAAGIGNLFGIVFAGTISDRKGRKLCFCIGIILYTLTCLLQFIGINFHDVSLLVVSEFVAGFSNKMVYLNFLVLLTRFLNKSQYEMGTIGWFVVGNGLSMIAVAGINEYFNNWRTIFYIYTIGYLICAATSFLVLWEDPIYLFDTGNLRESKRVIEAIGLENGVDFENNQRNVKSIDDIFEAKMTQIENNIGKPNKFDLRELLSCDIFTKILIIGVAGFLYTLAGSSIDLSIQNLNYSYNFNLFIIGVSNIFGFLSALYVIRIQPQRKRGFLFASLIYGILACLFIFPFCYQNGAVESVLIFLLRFFICWICNFYTRLKVDSFPEKYQLTTMGIVESIANFGHILGPFFVQLSNDRHLNPIFSINILRLTIGTIPIFFLNEEKATITKVEEDEPVVKGKKKLSEIAN